MGKTGLMAAAVLWAALAGPVTAEPVRFVAFGDLQDTSAEGRAADRALIERINTLAPDFSVFIGDIKGGDGLCSDALYDEVRGLFDAHEAPLVFTPGDNEWTDCWRAEAGAFDPVERKQAVVGRFVAAERSLGRKPMDLAQQKTQPENARWSREGILFATLHITGSNNNLRQDEAAIAEHLGRSGANGRWLRETFAEAEAEKAAALVLFVHANPQWEARYWTPTGFDRFRAQLAERATEFQKPVLVVHGDTHTFRVDRPFKAAPNVLRLEVFGPPEKGAVLVEADAAAPEVFRFTPVPTDPR